MTSFTQIIDEYVPYRQDVVNDTITTAEWSVEPTGPQVTPVPPSSTTAQAFFSYGIPGVFVLSVKLTLASGAIRIGQARISILDVSV